MTKLRQTLWELFTLLAILCTLTVLWEEYPLAHALAQVSWVAAAGYIGCLVYIWLTETEQ